MAIPSVNMLSNLVGGAIPNVMNAHNTFANNAHLRGINAIKEQYSPLTTQAEAASKLAYANLMGPQFLAKLLQNPGAIANMGDKAAREALLKSINAGMGSGTGQNYLNSMPQHTGIGEPSTNTFSGKLKNVFMELLGQQSNQGNNPFSQAAQAMPQQMQQIPQVSSAFGGPQMDQRKPKGAAMLEGEQWYDKDGKPVYEEDIGESGKLPMDRELTWAEKAGRLKGEEKQGEEAGKYRAKAQQEIGESQIGLSHSGAVLDRMTKIIKNPEFQEMRSKIPFFQDKQLSYLMKTGTPEQKKLIGDFLSTAESFIASTVQGFGGRPLVREFDLAQRQKISPKDPIHVAEGKLQAAIALHDIAEQKNDIISGLIDKGLSEVEAVKRANKMVDVSAIEKRTEELLRDKPTDQDIAYMAKKRGISVDEVKKMLKAKGY